MLEDLLEAHTSQSRQRATPKWWRSRIQDLEEYVGTPEYSAPELPGLRVTLKVDLEHDLDDQESMTRNSEALVKDL